LSAVLANEFPKYRDNQQDITAR